jgi:hypothetical protein
MRSLIVQQIHDKVFNAARNAACRCKCTLAAPAAVAVALHPGAGRGCRQLTRQAIFHRRAISAALAAPNARQARTPAPACGAERVAQAPS